MSEVSDLVIRDNPATCRIEAIRGAESGYTEYRLTATTITFTHTRVPESLRGRGIGTRLVEAGLALARERGLELIPVCPFFRSYLRAHPEAQGLLGVEGRRLLAHPS